MERIVKATRMVVYEGTEEWLDRVLKASFLQLGRVVKLPGGTIRIANEMRSADKDEVVELEKNPLEAANG